MYAFVQHMCTLRPKSVNPPPHTHTRATHSLSEIWERENMLNVTSASAVYMPRRRTNQDNSYARCTNQSYSRYTRDLSQYGAHVDSWESLRQSDNLPHSWVIFDKRSGSKSIKCVWYDLSLSDYQEHGLFPMWVGISNDARTQANVEMAAYGKLVAG